MKTYGQLKKNDYLYHIRLGFDKEYKRCIVCDKDKILNRTDNTFSYFFKQTFGANVQLTEDFINISHRIFDDFLVETTDIDCGIKIMTEQIYKVESKIKNLILDNMDIEKKNF